MLLIATEITAFHVMGVLLAVWAVVLAALGVTRHDFPGKGSGQVVVMAISAVLVAGAIGTAIGTAKDEPKGAEEAGQEANKSGGEGAAEPEQGGTPAPGTGADSGQQPGGSATTPAGGKPIKNLLIKADPSGQLRYDKTQLQASAGEVRITMENPSPVGHDVSIEGPGGVEKQGDVVQKGGSSEVEANLKPGTYTYYCSVPGHREAGMEGTLTVK